MRFIRVHGRVVPIKDDRDTGHHNAALAGATGTTVGAAYHISQQNKADAVEKLAKNYRSLKRFKATIQPGDILVLGSNNKNAGGVEVGEFYSKLPKKVQSLAKKLGIDAKSKVTNNATILSAAGAGKKYHAGIYMGKGTVVHMTTDQGAQFEKLSDVIGQQNTTALRFGNASKRETTKAIEFARGAVKNKMMYSNDLGIPSAISNIFTGITKKARPVFTPGVCHTLPIRAYAKREFKMGEHTFAGDFLKTPGITAVARHDVIRRGLPVIKSNFGNALKGLKYGLAAAIGVEAISFAAHKIKGQNENK